ncbi:MAG: HD-GYP domain-containing protein [Oscillospiraceae bacterium]|nr:HD-GYP domain-containing protein [Oscillospiraceae bacterium]
MPKKNPSGREKAPQEMNAAAVERFLETSRTLTAAMISLDILVAALSVSELLANGFGARVLTGLALVSCILLGYIAVYQNRRNERFHDDYYSFYKDELARRSGVAGQRINASEELTSQVIETLADAIDARDEYTTGHSYRVSEYARLMGEAMKLSPAEVESLRREALLHDVGKIGIPDAVLGKVGRLSEQEALAIRSHTTIGADIVSRLTSIPGAAAVARSHHERFDGKGYPMGLRGEEIPLHARIIAVADSFDAMHSDRIHRKGLPPEVIRGELEKGRGTQFDPKCLNVFLELLADGKLNPVFSLSSRMRKEGTQIELRSALQARCEQEAEAIRRDKKPILSVNDDAATRIKSAQSALALKYSQRFNFVVVTLVPKEGQMVSRSEIQQAMGAISFAAKNTLEGAGVCSYCGETQLLVLLYDTSTNSVDMLLQRIYLDFYRLVDSRRFDLTHFEI